MEITYIILFVVVAIIMSAISYFLGVSKDKLKKQSLENQIDTALNDKERLEQHNEMLFSEKEKIAFQNKELLDTNNDLLTRNSAFTRDLAVFANEKESLKSKINDIFSEKTKLETKFNELVDSYNALLTKKSSLNSELAVSNNANANLLKEVADLKQNFENSEKQFKESFENIATKILEDRIKTINKDGESQIKKSIEPLEKELTEFKTRIETIYLNETRERASISKELENLLKLNRQLSSDADSLARAIKGENNPKMQGDWGEMILDTILSNSGLKRDEHYFAQESVTDEDGARKRPDIIVRYPDKREIIIDSKVSLTAFSRYVSAVTDEERDEAIKSHVISIRRHVDDLASKQYDNRENSLDFVMMFIPIEPAYILALNSDNTLWEYAYKRKIIIITPTHLITALKLIYDLWSRDAQNRNAIDIAARGAVMYDKFVGFITDMQAIGTSLDKTRKGYDLALNKLSTGKGNLVRQAEILKELGVRASKELNISANELIEPENTDKTE
ncbi:MAG: DNA recombination protein RmuC [Rikenellaceae bacterium]